MLNNFLKKMMDPTLNQFTNKENDFNQSLIISDLVVIYGSLGEDKLFRQKVTADVRQFDQQLFETALRRARKEQVTSSIALDKFQVLLGCLASTKMEDIEDYDEYPDEFQCSISLSILSDPVQLPSSKCNVERAFIKKALLDNEMDPFNRSPLNVKQLIEMPELKAKIAAWKKEQQIKNTKERKGEITDEELEDALQGDIPDDFACALSFCVRYSALLVS